MDVVNRDSYEADMARALSRTFRQQLTIVMDTLGDSPSLDKLTPALFADMQAALQAVIRPVLEKVYLAQAEALTSEPPRTKQAGIGVEWGLVNQRAADWASRYSFELVRGIVDTTRTTLQRQVGDFFADSRTLADLRAALESSFGPVRAAMIAQTEVTRAASEAESMFADELRKLGLVVTFRWQTNADDLVCPICGPRNGKLQGDGWQDLPPAHPRCRCWANSVVISEVKAEYLRPVKADSDPEGYAILYLDRIDGLLKTQQEVKRLADSVGVDFEPAPVDELHITLVYAEHIADDPLRAIGMTTTMDRFQLASTELDWFGEDDTRKALVARVSNAADSDGLRAFQATVYEAFLERSDPSMGLSDYSVPDAWQPHVTLGYGSPFDAGVIDVEFDAARFVVARDDYQSVVEVEAG